MWLGNQILSKKIMEWSRWRQLEKDDRSKPLNASASDLMDKACGEPRAAKMAFQKYGQNW